MRNFIFGTLLGMALATGVILYFDWSAWRPVVEGQGTYIASQWHIIYEQKKEIAKYHKENVFLCKLLAKCARKPEI